MAEIGFKLDVRSNLADLTRNIDLVERQHIPFVTAYALTKTAQDIKAAEVEVMAKVFDRPTRFTLNALYVKPATKTSLTAAVLFKDGFGSVPAWRYLGPQIEGGPRVHKSTERKFIALNIMKRNEYAVPGQGAPLDANGNVSGALMNRILSDMSLRNDPYQNTTARARKRNRSRNRGRYFLLRPEDEYAAVAGFGNIRRRVPAGIYHRQGARDIVPVIMFVRRPLYEKRFPFHQTAELAYHRNFARRFREGWRRYVRYPARRVA